VCEQTNCPLWTVCKIKHIKAEAFRRIFSKPEPQQSEIQIEKIISGSLFGVWMLQETWM